MNLHLEGRPVVGRVDLEAADAFVVQMGGELFESRDERSELLLALTEVLSQLDVECLTSLLRAGPSGLELVGCPVEASQCL